MDTYKQVVTRLDPSDKLKVECGDMVVDFTLDKDGVPVVVVDCPQGLHTHQYRKAEGVRHGGIRVSEDSNLCIHRGYEGPSS